MDFLGRAERRRRCPVPRTMQPSMRVVRLGKRIRQELKDLSWRVPELKDSVFPGDFARLARVVGPYTMVTYGRLRGLYDAVRSVVAQNVPGDLVECGVARGGSAGLMGLAVKKLNARRTLWGFDTFAGLPPPTSDDPDYEIAKAFTGTCRGDITEVRALFASWGILDCSNLVQGLFEDTLPHSEIEHIAVLHIDG